MFNIKREEIPELRICVEFLTSNGMYVTELGCTGMVQEGPNKGLIEFHGMFEADSPGVLCSAKIRFRDQEADQSIEGTSGKAMPGEDMLFYCEAHRVETEEEPDFLDLGASFEEEEWDDWDD